MLQGEHFAIMLTFIKLSFAIKTFVLTILEWPLKTGFTEIAIIIMMIISIISTYDHNHAFLCENSPESISSNASAHLAESYHSDVIARNLRLLIVNI